MEEKRENSNIWSTKRVDQWMADYQNGISRRPNPWADGLIGIKKPKIIFEYTPEEIEEIAKCANDIVYFANTYCWCLQGTRGFQPIKLRDYQENMLREYQNNRFNITLSSRQVGKCLISGELGLQKDGNTFNQYIEDIYFDNKGGVLSKIKKFLFKIYRKL